MNSNRFLKNLTKTRLSLITAILLSFGSFSNAQTVSYYSFAQTQETYTALSNPTNIVTAGAASGTGFLDENVYTLDNVIPFSFPFNGTNFSSVKIHVNGFLSFGTETTSSSDPIGSGYSYSGVISPLAADLSSFYNINGNSSSIDYAVVGTAPNREFVVQWSHFRPYASSQNSSAYHDWNFQARLHENGSIRYVYSMTSVGNPSAGNAKVGLRGTSSSDYINRTAAGNSTSNWNNSTPGTNSSNGIATNYNYLPSQGLTFTWIPPSACIIPTAQPSSLNLTNNGIIINGNFTASSPAADRYLIVRNLNGATPNAPVNGTVYSTGENTSLNSYVAYYGPNTTFENNYNHGIRGNNQYTYTVYSVNSNCTNGPVYNVQNPLTGTITNCPITVNGITTSNITANSFTVNWPTSENGNASPMNTVIEVATDSNFTNQITGSPFTLSASSTSQNITGVLPNTQYFIRGKNVSTQCQSSYSSTANLYTACVPTTTLNENFDTVTGNNLPNCWSKILTSNNGSIPTISVTTTDTFSSPNNISFYGNGATMTNAATKAILVSPQLTNLNAGTHRLRIKARRTSADIKLQIVALTGNTASAAVDVIETIPLTTTYQEYTVYLTSYTGSGNYLGIRRVDGSTYSYMYIDDVIWEPTPSCSELSVVNVNSVSYNGANISWANAGNQQPANGYEYIVTTTNTPPADTETFTNLASGTNSINLSSLANGTYYFWIRRICSSAEKSPWKSVTFTTIPTTPAPWKEEFLTSTYPQGWTNGANPFELGTQRGATGIGNSARNLNKNLYLGIPTGSFNTIAVGPLATNNYELSFYYKQTDYESPFNPLTNWGNFDVQISTNFGASWTTIGTVNNEAGTGNYIKKTYSLAGYQGQFVQVKIVANRTAGDFDLSFDDFEIKENQTLATQEVSKNTVKIYPNPTTSLIKIDSKEKVKSYELYNVSGQLINKGGRAHEISLDSFNTGLYILKITLETNQTFIQKVIKK
ncbi:Por secretion system C-terminal sorting domain-containing protein [Chryseobacterium arachidis]|uniref:Por secretion system C-terminal sorting domain-containing protein n=1 Tax=Chryseobacterium arachidis TaxID=1416778 RepID=A0A1M5LTH2_9FLAO|nr:Por secretion system C-terminal sorting domain-containing protein [Chryseobacterium arachidis]